MLILSKRFCIWFFSEGFCKPLIELIHHDTFSATQLLDTGRKLNVHKTFNLRPVSTGSLSVKSRIWKSAVILCGTYSWTILFSTDNDVTLSFFWHWKMSHIKSANRFGFPMFFFVRHQRMVWRFLYFSFIYCLKFFHP